MKNKLLKIFILIGFVFLLCSCGWNDVKDKPGFVCNYKYSGTNDFSVGLGNFTKYSFYFTAKDGDNGSVPKHNVSPYNTAKNYDNSRYFGAKYTVGGKDYYYVLYDEGGSEIPHDVTTKSELRVKYDDVDYSTINDYIEDRFKCPGNVYFKQKSGNTYHLELESSSCGSKDTCYTFSLDSSAYNTNNQTEDSYSSTCIYQHPKSGEIVSITVNDLEGEYLKSEQSLRNHSNLKSYFTFQYKNSDLNMSNINVGDSASDIYTTGKTKKIKIDSAFAYYSYLSKSIGVSSIKCPDVYAQADSGNVVKITMDQYDTNSSSQYSFPQNTKLNIINSTVVNTDTKEEMKDEDGDGESEIDDLYDNDGSRECSYYLNNSKISFTVIYNEADNDIEFKAEASGKDVVYYEKDGLVQEFANAYKVGKCPAYISCVNYNDSGEKLCLGPQSESSCKVTKSNGKTLDKNFNLCSIYNNSGEEVEDVEEYFADLTLEFNGLDMPIEPMTCEELMGSNLIKVLRMFINGIRIAGAIICIVKASGSILPAVYSHDADALKKGAKTCVILAVVLCVIGLFPTLIKLIGNIAGFDLSCM